MADLKIFKVGILTISDRVSKSLSIDKSGPALKSKIEILPRFEVNKTEVVPDELDQIQLKIKQWSDELDLILTTGGTGFGVRDTTPEAVFPLLHKLCPGLVQQMLNTSLSITPMASLSRPVAGIRDSCLIITLPGSPKASVENLLAIQKALIHGLELINSDSGENVHKKMNEGEIKIEEEEIKIEDKENEKGNWDGKCRCDRDDEIVGSVDDLDSSFKRSSKYPLITLVKALDLIKHSANQCKSKRINPIILNKVDDSLINKTLAESIISKVNVPNYRASIVDGYALPNNDINMDYNVISSIGLAGINHSEIELKLDQCMKTTTGGSIPNNCNRVIMIEDTKLLENDLNNDQEKLIKLIKQPKPFENIREIGNDLKIGEAIFKSGQFISNYSIGSSIGSIIGAGVDEVKVMRSPKVAVMSSGKELTDNFNELLPGKVIDTNRPSLLNQLKSDGVNTLDLGIITDNKELLEKEIINALKDDELDILITSGGVSMGEADFIKPILNNLNHCEIKFGRIFIKPGKPATFATYKFEGKLKLIFALPGNPVSAMVMYHVLVKKAIDILMCKDDKNNEIEVELKHDIKLDPRPEYHRCNINFNNGNLFAQSTGNQVSSKLTSMLNANGLLILPNQTAEKKSLKKGDKVMAMVIGDLILS